MNGQDSGLFFKLVKVSKWGYLFVPFLASGYVTKVTMLMAQAAPNYTEGTDFDYILWGAVLFLNLIIIASSLPGFFFFHYFYKLITTFKKKDLIESKKLMKKINIALVIQIPINVYTYFVGFMSLDSINKFMEGFDPLDKKKVYDEIDNFYVYMDISEWILPSLENSMPLIIMIALHFIYKNISEKIEIEQELSTVV